MKKNKMNIFFRLAFILLIVCVVMFVVSIIVAYLLDNPVLSVVFSGGGAFLAILGIIFAGISKPKTIKTESDFENNENNENGIDN